MSTNFDNYKPKIVKQKHCFTDTHNDHISYNEEDDISVWIENIINEDDDDNDDIDFDMIL